MTRRSDRLAWAVAAGLLVSLALVGGLIAQSWRDDAHRAPAHRAQFFLVALA